MSEDHSDKKCENPIRCLMTRFSDVVSTWAVCLLCGGVLFVDLLSSIAILNGNTNKSTIPTIKCSCKQ